jgi:hypothetical protein
MSFSVAALEPEETSRVEPTPVPPANGFPEKPPLSFMLTNIPIWVWIATTLLLVAASVTVFLVSTARRRQQ